MKNFFIIVAVALAMSVTGCSGGKVKKAKPADETYNEALALYEKKDYEDAIAGFREVVAKYPMSSFAVLARMKIGDSYYDDKNYPEAITAYREFEKLHPTNENLPYVIYRLAMSYFLQITTLDRDQTATSNALKEFNRLISRFPGSQYTEEARNNISTCKNYLAEHDFYIGRFYYKKEKDKAALRRFEQVLRDYPDFKGRDRVYYFAAKTHIAMGEVDTGQRMLKTMLSDYPDSTFRLEALRILEGKGSRN